MTFQNVKKNSTEHTRVSETVGGHQKAVTRRTCKEVACHGTQKDYSETKIRHLGSNQMVKEPVPGVYLSTRGAVYREY